jgi:uncharacterized protein YdaU (DUF1376 family)
VKSPAFQFYPDDFVGSGTVALLRDHEIGIYLMLLCLDWSDDGFVFPAATDSDELERLAAWCKTTPKRLASAWTRLAQAFPASEDSRRRNPRLQRERIKQATWREKSSTAGKKGAATRWAKDDQPHANGDGVGHPVVITKPSPTGSPNDGIPFPSPTPVTTKAPTGIAPVGASRDLPVADAPQPAPEPPAPPKPSPYPKFVAQFGDRWAALVGKPDFGRIAGDLKDLHRVHGPTVLLGALDNFARHRSIAVAQGTTRPDGWPQFVADFADYIPKRGAAA